MLQHVVKKPWGFYHVLIEGNGWLVKRIVVLPGQSTSLQRHTKRGELIVKIPEGRSWFTPPWTEHRLTEGDYIEIQTGIIDESDVIRVADDYGRAGQ